MQSFLFTIHFFLEILINSNFIAWKQKGNYVAWPIEFNCSEESSKSQSIAHLAIDLLRYWRVLTVAKRTCKISNRSWLAQIIASIKIRNIKSFRCSTREEEKSTTIQSYSFRRESKMNEWMTFNSAWMSRGSTHSIKFRYVIWLKPTIYSKKNHLPIFIEMWSKSHSRLLCIRTW